MARNDSETKIAVLTEQVKVISEDLKEHRNDTRQGWADVRKDIASLRAEVVGRMDRHEDQDQKNFKAIDDRVILADKADIAREAARTAVEKFKKWQWSIVAGGVVSILWGLLQYAEPVISRLLKGN